MRELLRAVSIILLPIITGCQATEDPFQMAHLSSAEGDLAPPSTAKEQTASLILDVDKNGVDDFVIASRRSGTSLAWYRRIATGWSRYLIEDETLPIEAGGAVWDIDGDGDLDVVMGGDGRSNQVWWWENPYPAYAPDTPWIRREIKNSGEAQHHDQIFGDFDGDGRGELVFWNQGARRLFLAEIPANPRRPEPWPLTEIYAWSSSEPEHEGLARADIDLDGQVDIVGGGRWFKHLGGTNYSARVIDARQTSARVAVGQLRKGGRPEVVMVMGDGQGPLKWYTWDSAGWTGYDLLCREVDHGHSLQVADMNGDGHQDIFVAEMRLRGNNAGAKMWIFLGNGTSGFATTAVATGYGNHESKVGDLDGDGDMDILGKPYDWETPRVDIWLGGTSHQALDNWQRHVVDTEKPWRAVFVTPADLDGDGLQDLVTGGWWYRNPGSPSGTWARQAIGTPLHNMAAVHDLDGDGDMDVLGTQGQGSDTDARFVWARNDGTGAFTIRADLPSGDGDFLQGVAVEQFHAGGPLQVALSWHTAGKGVQQLTVPADPSTQAWTWDRITAESQDEGLSAGDIDGDGDADLLLGTQWLRNDGASWSMQRLSQAGGDPDRNRLADVNGDGRLDAVVGFEAVSQPGKLAWYEQGASPTGLWTERVIANPSGPGAVVGPMSLDVADMDADGDVDVVVGEHNKAEPEAASLYILENADGRGTDWKRHTVYTGDEHHDGAQVVDIEGDGDLDIVSIGWTHGRVVLYENRAITAASTANSRSPEPEALASARATPAAVERSFPRYWGLSYR